MKPSSLKLVPYSLLLCMCLFKPFRVVVSEPVEVNAPATNEDDEIGRITYDQRQTGKYNIHVSIKDVAIIEMDKNEVDDPSYSDDDYYYDDGYMTVAPIFLNTLTSTKQPIEPSTTLSTSTKNPEESTTTTSNPITTISQSNITYSPKLLADIAATHASKPNKTFTLFNATKVTSPIPPTKMPIKPAQNVIILDEFTPSQSSPTSTHKPLMSTTGRPAFGNARSKILPIQSILKEPLLHPRHHLNAPHLPPLTYPGRTETDFYNEPNDNDSKIYKFKAHRVHRQNPALPRETPEALAYPIPYLHAISPRRCRNSQYRDMTGNCRSKRSSSFLKKLFNMLIKLPFANEHRNGDRDDE